MVLAIGCGTVVVAPDGIAMTVSSSVSPRRHSVLASMDDGFVVAAPCAALRSATSAPLVGSGISIAWGVLAPSGVPVMDVAAEVVEIRWTSRRAWKISSSVKSENGSRLLRIVPEKRVGSGRVSVCSHGTVYRIHLPCGTMTIFSRKSNKPIKPISIS